MNIIKLNKYTISYIILIVLINIGFSFVPLVPVFGEMFPPLSLAVGLIFVKIDDPFVKLGIITLPLHI